MARDRSRTAVAALADGPGGQQRPAGSVNLPPDHGLRHLRAAHGFTLVEVMVVVLIIGIMLTFATLSVGDRAAGDTLDLEARRLEELFRLASEEAELKGFEIGFRHTPTLYQFVAVDAEGDWAPITEGPLRPRGIPPLLSLRLRVDGRPVPPAQDLPPGGGTGDDEEPGLEPQVLFLSSGELTAFSLELGAAGLADGRLLSGDLLGRLTLEVVQPGSLR